MFRNLEKLFYLKYEILTKKNKNEFKKIALICTWPMSIRDLIMNTPFIKTLRENFPEAEIHLITDKDLFDKVKEKIKFF